MLRTMARKSDLVQGSLRKTLRTNVIRNVSAQCPKRKYHNRLNSIRNEPSRQWQSPSLSLCRYYSSDLPPHTRVNLPALSPTMESGKIVSWEKKEGDRLNEGDLLAEIETDKATMGFETPEEGYLAKILIPAGAKDVPIGKLVCIITENEKDIAAFKDFKDDGQVAAPQTTPPSPAVATPSPVVTPPSPPPSATIPQTQASSSRVYASPMAKRLAESQNLRLQGKGTGLFGSITSSDLQGVTPTVAAAISEEKGVAATPTKAVIPAGAAFLDIPLSNMRTTIAKRLLQSKQSVPHYYLSVDINVDRVIKLRGRFNKKFEKSKEGVKLSLNDFVVKAVALANRKVPEANSAWMDTFIRQFDRVDVSLAVATDRGLITPIIFGADNKGVLEISKIIKILAGKAREGKLQPQEYQGGTIGVSNLGMFGVNNFCAIINPPQSCILAVGTTVKRLIADDSEKGFKEAQFMTVTLSCDHRVVDGAVGAKWLSIFREFLEDPESMVI